MTNIYSVCGHGVNLSQTLAQGPAEHLKKDKEAKDVIGGAFDIHNIASFLVLRKAGVFQVYAEQAL